MQNVAFYVLLHEIINLHSESMDSWWLSYLVKILPAVLWLLVRRITGMTGQWHSHVGVVGVRAPQKFKLGVRYPAPKS